MPTRINPGSSSSGSAITREPGNLTGNSDYDKWLQALDQYKQTGVVPAGYEPFDNPALPIMPAGNRRTFMDKYGWLIMASLPAAGVAGGELGWFGNGADASLAGTSAATAGLSDGAATSGLSYLPGTALATEAAPTAGAASMIAPAITPALSSSTISGATQAAGPAATAGSHGMLGMSYGDLIKLGLQAGGNYLSAGKQQKRTGFHGDLTSPENALNGYLSAIYRLGEGMQNEKPFTASSSYVAAPPAPISIPGLPFQIGGGMGMDPALSNPALLSAPNHSGDLFQFDPFQGVAQKQFGSVPSGAGSAATDRVPVRRRTLDSV